MNNSESPISINEHLSALLDDEAGSFEERRVLDELKADQKLSQKLSTYALIGETMRTGDTEKPMLSLGSSFLDGIHKKIELEDDFNVVVVDSDVKTNNESQSQNKLNPFSWLRPVGGFAVAASVGALAFMGLQNMGVLSSPNSQPSNYVDSSAPTAIVGNAPVTVPSSEILVDSSIAANDQYVNADVETRAFLKRYVDSHMQYATTSAFVPSVRTIAYTDNQ
ncbi:MAG: sigma-E factor negative regulatory protein [Cocleimonas sp.]